MSVVRRHEAAEDGQMMILRPSSRYCASIAHC